jgi:protein-S-isoprenylcysteine O-methyltransferase Ste14
MSTGPSLAWRSLLAGLWFGLWFFGAFPLGIQALAGGALAPRWGAAGAAGGLLVAGGLAVVAALVARFVREGRGTQAPFHPPQQLVAGGCYRWLRNPMYAAYAAVIAGEALALRSPWVGAYAAAFLAVAHAYVVRVEEPALRARFGAAYAEYCAQVPRWWLRLPARAAQEPTRSARSAASKQSSSASSKTPRW